MVVAYHGDVVDWRLVVEQQTTAGHVVALDSHVQRSETVLGLGQHLGTSLQQQVNRRLVTTPCRTVQRRQTVLHSRCKVTIRAHKMAKNRVDLSPAPIYIFWNFVFNTVKCEIFLFKSVCNN